ncbi:MAG TPA: hypothetical protein VFW78_12100 [Bacteroidia bacterium]|nr:hypothetical protein [Bacteroidia bacterium]
MHVLPEQMKQELQLEQIRKAYFSKLIASKTSVDDIMPLFTKAKGIFDLGKKTHKRRKK